MPRKLDNWLEGYAAYTDGMETPAIYNLWVGIGTILAAAQRKIQLKMGKITVHSNMLLILVGPAGAVRKSTALDIGKDLLLGVEEYGHKIEIAPAKTSGAALVSRMTRINNPKHQSLTAYSSELGTLLGANNVDVSDILTDLWDCKKNFDKETIGRGAEKITAPWVHILAATTPVWLADNLPKTATEGGFVSRGIFPYAETNDNWVPIPEESEDQVAVGRALIHDLADIAGTEGTFAFSHDAKEFYKEWYLDRRNFAPKYDNRMLTYYNRKHVHVLKTAMAFSLARGDDLILETRDLACAIESVEDVERSMSLAFQGVGRNLTSMDQERIKRQILGAGERGASYKQILAANIHSIDRQQIDIILMTLREMGVITMNKSTFYDRRLIAGAGGAGS